MLMVENEIKHVELTWARLPAADLTGDNQFRFTGGFSCEDQKKKNNT